MKVLLVLSATLALVSCQFGLPGVGKLGEVASSAASSASNAAGTAANAIESALKADFGGFSKSFNKVYSSPEEEKLRFDNYKLNRDKVDAINKGFGGAANTFLAGINNLSDMLYDEFNKLYNGFKANIKNRDGPDVEKFAKTNEPLPESVDWRAKGAVSPVKYQDQCASCWAFAAAGALEAHNYMKTGKLVNISTQNLIDCCTNKYENQGCNGGSTEPAFKYIKENKGINAESAYAYEGKNQECRYQPESVASCTGYGVVPQGDEKALQEVVAKIGPVTAAIHVTEALQNYKSGIFYDPKCGSTIDHVNHAIVIVGYGKDKDGMEYWLIKNSYSSFWGEDGYVRLARNKNNHCGIATWVTYPKV